MKIYYDGACRICHAEIMRYKKKLIEKGATGIRIIDITDPDIKPETEGLNPREIRRKIHVRTADGVLHSGMDAILEIWKRIPDMNWAATLISLPGILQIARLVYFVFARGIRPLLPKRSREGCDSGTCSF